MVFSITLIGALIIFCLTIGVPIGISIGAATAVTMYFTCKIPLISITQNAFTALDTFPLLAVLFSSSRESNELRRHLPAACQACRQHRGAVSGGLAMVTVVACMFFSAISGSAVATVSGIGGFMIRK